MHEPPCEPLVKCRAETSDRLTTLEEKVCNIEAMTQKMLGIVEAWDAGQGFFKVMKAGSKIVIWVAGTWAAIVAIGKYIKDLP